MFNIGFSEFIILGIIILICVDPRKLPELARVVGRIVGDFKRTLNDIKLHDLTKDLTKFNDLSSLDLEKLLEEKKRKEGALTPKPEANSDKSTTPSSTDEKKS